MKQTNPRLTPYGALWVGRATYPWRKRRHLRPVDMSREERTATAQLARAERLTLVQAAARVTGVPEAWLREMTEGAFAPSPMLRVADAVFWYRQDAKRAASVHPLVLEVVYIAEEFPAIPSCRECFAPAGADHHAGCSMVPVQAALARAVGHIGRLWDAVDRYAMHDPDCPINLYGPADQHAGFGCACRRRTPSAHVCTCGLDEALPPRQRVEE